MDLKQKTLNKKIPVPLYYQLKEILLEYIRHTESGSALPTELDLCQHFAISRPTVRQAISELVAEGYLLRIKGKGTFIAEPKIKQDFLIALKSFSEEMQEKGLIPGTKILEFALIPADEKVSEALMILPGNQVVHLSRLRSANNLLIVLVSTFLPAARVPDICAKDLEHGSLYRVLEHDYNYSIARATRTLEARVAGEYEARLLGIKTGAAIQFIETTTYLDDGTPIEYSSAWYRGDRSTFTFELKKLL